MYDMGDIPDARLTESGDVPGVRGYTDLASYR
jgi:hypothetical protein